MSDTSTAHTISRATVLGAGTMGNGIAQVCAQADIDVVLYDLNQDAVNSGLANIEAMLAKAVSKNKISAEQMASTLGRVRLSTDLKESCNDSQLVIEAIPENLKLKQSVLAEVEDVVDESCLIASNTSSLSISKIAAGMSKPHRFLGMHFFNPVPLMSLLEVVVGDQSSDSSCDLAVELSKRFGKEPIVVKDAPGFASSRLGVCIGLEAMRMVEDGVASASDIDKAMELGYRHPMGPLRLTDLVGLDVRLGIAEYLGEKLGDRFAPPQILRDMVAAGKLGKKSGEGFYKW
ncbi:MAG: 3-hydroxyacyl-CoA dehydrogenase family protein [Planctomycetota bacterium]|jgi:3-hydroxybutyryl-CoA dehydrogenase|nr:3-hydroxyacyl-CoA dehydrogenase family protein [Planctomycetota bacterium]